MRKALLCFGIILSTLICATPMAFSQSDILINHKSTVLEEIPDNWIDSAKKNLNIFYGASDFGRQITDGGMTALVNSSPSFALKFAFSSIQEETELTIIENESDLSLGRDWINITSNYLNNNPTCNVVMWAWDSVTHMNIEDYLYSMDSLINVYGKDGSANRENPVTFVFMNGHSSSGIYNDTTHTANDRIREYCIDSGRVFFDYNDIELWNPDGRYYGDGNPDGSYSGHYNLHSDLSHNLLYTDGRGNWGNEWISQNPTHINSLLSEETVCTSCHGSEGSIIDGGDDSRLNCVLKGIAAWNLWARIAGWEGSTDTLALLSNISIETRPGNEQSSDTISTGYNLAGNSTAAAITWIRNNTSTMSLHLPFEGGDSISLLDISGNNHNAIKEITVPEYQPIWNSNSGVDKSGAYQFLGDDYLTVPNGFPTGSSYTKSAWINISQGGYNHIISGSVLGITHTLMVTNDSSLVASHHSSIRMTEDPEKLNMNTWYHVAVTFDYDNRILILFKNGVEVSRDTISFTYQNITDGNALIGSLETSFNFNGLIDNVAIFNYELSPQQINSIYHNGFNNIVPQETEVADAWKAVITPYTSTTMGRADTTETIYIETPQATDISLYSTSGDNRVGDSLICNNNLNALAAVSAINWVKNGISITAQNLPFEGGSTDALIDISGNDNNASVEASVPSWHPTWNASSGHNGYGAFSFDGDDYLIGGNSFPARSSYTKTIWINRDVNGLHNILSGSQVGITHTLGVGTDSLLFASHHASISLVRDTERLEMDTWYFVAVTFDYESRELTLYKNGLVVDSEIISTTYQNIDDEGLFIGAIATDFNFSGILDNAKIYDYALSPEQILSLHNTDSIIVPEEISLEDVWQADITAYSNSTMGATKPSNKIEFENAGVSKVVIATAPGVNMESDTLTCNFELNPIATTSAVSWSLNNEPIMNMYLPFEGGDSNAYKDISGNDNHAMFDASFTHPTWNASAGYNGNGAYNFDGNDFLNAGNVLPVGNSYTKSAWIYATSSGSNNILSGTTTGLTHMLLVNPDNVVSSTHHSSFRFVEDTEPINLNTWYLITVTFDYDSRVMCLYKNGVEVDRDTLTYQYIDLDNGNVLVGALASTYEFSGTIDEPRIYNRALSGEQVYALYESEPIIVPQETASGQQWKATVFPYTDNDSGESDSSKVLTLGTPNLINARVSMRNSINPLIDSIQCILSPNPHVTNSAITWYRNDTSIMSLYLPFEGGYPEYLYNASGNGVLSEVDDSTETSPNWLPTGGYDGNGALEFTGDDFISAGNIFPDSSSYTKTAWVNFNESGYNNIISGSVIGESHWFRVNTDNILLAGHHTSVRELESPSPLLPNTWYFVGLSYNMNTRQMIMYINGAEVARTTVNFIYREVQDSSVFVGAFADNGDFGFHGTIDDARIYNIPLSSEQINQLYTSSSIIVPEQTFEGDEWYASITPFSRTARGNSMLTNVQSLGLIELDEIPSQTINEGGTFVDVILDNFVEDCCFPDSVLSWQVNNNEELIVEIIDSVPMVARVTAPTSDYYGYNTLTFLVTDPNDVEDSVKADYIIIPVNDPPVFLDTIPGDTITEGGDFMTIELNDFINDVDDFTNTLKIQAIGSSLIIDIDETTHIATISTPNEDWYGIDTVTFTVIDTSNASASQDVIFVGIPVNDSPTEITLTPSVISEETQIAELVGVLSAIDIDNSTHVFTLVEDDNIQSENDKFQITNGNELILNSTLDYSVANEHIIAVKADDYNGGVLIQAITITVTEAGSSLVETNKEFSFLIYPNPSNGKMHIQKNNNKEVKLSVYNLVGKLVHFEEFHNGEKELDLYHLDSGMYLMNINSDKFSKTIKIKIN